MVCRPFVRRTRNNPRTIVIIKPCCLGDLIMTTPLLDEIHRAYPTATITYVAGSWSKVIPEHSPVVNTIIDSGTVGIAGRYSLSDYMKLSRMLWHYHFDMAFVLDRSPLMTLLPWLAGIPRRVGPDSLGRGFSLTDRVPVSSSPTHLQHQAEMYLNLARAIGLPISTPHMHFTPTETERQTVLPKTGRRIALFVGGGSNPGMELTAKRWPLERYRQVAQRLIQELHAQILLIGGESDIALNQQLQDELSAPSAIPLDVFGFRRYPRAQGERQLTIGFPAPLEGTETSDMVINITGKTTLGELAAQLEQCDLFIGNDSSPMHLAAAVHIPVLAIFGPTSPQEYGPYPLNDPHHIALWRHPTGQPCFFLGKMQTCNNCTCMQAVSVEEVWEAVQRLIPSPQHKEVPR